MPAVGEFGGKQRAVAVGLVGELLEVRPGAHSSATPKSSRRVR
ncbi:hypothetical protein [Streptomyces sp. NPDC127112]